MKINNVISVVDENYIFHWKANVITHDWSKRVKWLNMAQPKIGNIRSSDILQFWKDPTCCEKYLKDDNHNSFYLTLNICSDICAWTLSVPESSQFSLTELRSRKTVRLFTALCFLVFLFDRWQRGCEQSIENCLLLETDNVHRRISSVNIFAPNDHNVL